MIASQIYISVGIVALLIIGAIIFFLRKDKKSKPLSTLAALALVFVLAGIIFSEDKIMGYSLMGVGIVLAVIDVVLKYRAKC